VTLPRDGMLLIDKPGGATSHDLVSRARRISGQRRIGHAGTLDPSATGLLPLLLGRATRLLRFMPTSPKVYEGQFRLGLTTQTDDIDGEVLSRHSGPLPGEEAVRESALSLEGQSLQVPPRVSARKIGGRRMYDLARQGIEVSAAATPIEVENFRISPADRGDTFRFCVEVSGGTYVRGLVRDIGEKLGSGATLTELRRTRIAKMRVEDAIVLDRDIPDIQEKVANAIIPLSEIPLAVPRVLLDSEELTERFLHGQTVDPGSELLEGTVGVFEPSGTLLGLAETRGQSLRPLVVIGTPKGRPDRP
jgi:tRNA pseudouridine55 synthase